jgi:hypothetical protein
VWGKAVDLLRGAGIPKRLIRSYVLIGMNDTPDQAWAKCKFVESYGCKALPMWFHALDAMEKNTVTTEQMESGWNNYERRKIMQFFYWHKNAVKQAGEC